MPGQHSGCRPMRTFPFQRAPGTRVCPFHPDSLSRVSLVQQLRNFKIIHCIIAADRFSGCRVDGLQRNPGWGHKGLLFSASGFPRAFSYSPPRKQDRCAANGRFDHGFRIKPQGRFAGRPRISGTRLEIGRFRTLLIPDGITVLPGSFRFIESPVRGGKQLTPVIGPGAIPVKKVTIRRL